MAIELDLYGKIRRLHNEGHSKRQIARIWDAVATQLRNTAREKSPMTSEGL